MKRLRDMDVKDKLLLLIAIAIGFTLLWLFFGLPFLNLSDEQSDVVVQITMIVFLALLVLYLVCFFKFYAKESAVEKATKYVLRYDTFSLLRNNITEKLYSLCFFHIATIQHSSGATLELLLKEQRNEYTCVGFFRQVMVQEETIVWAEKEITVALQTYFEKQVLREKISLLLFICVDRVSPIF